MNFITETLLPNETFKYLDEDTSENIEYFEKFSDKETLTAPMTADEMAAFFNIERKALSSFICSTPFKTVLPTAVHELPTFVDFTEHCGKMKPTVRCLILSHCPLLNSCRALPIKTTFRQDARYRSLRLCSA